MIHFKTAAPIAALLTCFTFTSVAQQSESVILYNSNPVKVELQGDKIASFIGEAPSGYMDGYDLTKKNDIKVDPTIVNQPILENSNLKNADYSILSKERIMLNYKPGFATLDKVIINELNTIASRLNADPNAKVLLTIHIDSANARSQKLSDNRLQSAKSYLKIKGISLDRVQTETLEGPSMLDVIAVNFLK